MDRRQIGSLQVSVVGLGCNNFGWRLDNAGSARVLRAALDAGIDKALARFAEARGRTLLELAVSWLLSRRLVASVIAGATSPAQVRANAAAAGWALDAAELAEVDRVLGAGGA